jgi:hypothetical protein
MPATAVGISTYVEAMGAIRNMLTEFKDGIKDFEGKLSVAEQVGNQAAIGVGLDAAVDTTDGSRARVALDAMEVDLYGGMMAIYDMYLQIAALES